MKNSLLIILSLFFMAFAGHVSAQDKGSSAGLVTPDNSKEAGSETRDNQDPVAAAGGPVSTAPKQPAAGSATASTSSGMKGLGQRSSETGVALYDAGKIREAIAALKQASKLSPGDAQVLFMLGMAYSEAKAYKDAEESFKRATRAKPDWPEAHFQVGLMNYILGRKIQAKEEYRKLREINSPLAGTLLRIIQDKSYPVRMTQSISQNRADSMAKPEQVVPVSGGGASTSPNSSNRTANGPEDRAASALSNKSPAASASSNKSPAASPLSNKSPAASALSNKSAAASALLNKSPAASAPSNKSPAASAPSNKSPAASALSNKSPAASTSGVDVNEEVLTKIYKIGVGDVLDIRLFNSASNRSTLYTVVNDGSIDLPIAGGPVTAAGLTSEDLQERITAELKRREVEGAPVSVGVRQFVSHTLIINGLVSNPGTKLLRREAVPLYVIMAEAQPRQDATRAVVLRDTTASLLNLDDPAALNFIVRPGDVINIAARPQEFYYIAGRVKFPGQKTFQPGITLLQAILAAGGLERQTDNVVELSREAAQGRLTTTKVSLKEIKSGKTEDPKLQPGDRIEVVR